MAHAFNPFLIQQARQAVKQAFVPSDPVAGGGAPPGGDPSMGGAPPDPSMGGGAPPDPSGGMPMDPSGGGGMPPPDPNAGMPPMPSSDSSLPDIDSKVQQAVQTAIQGAGIAGQGGPKQPKPDINTVATDLFQLKKMFLAYMRRQGIELPPDILDGPNRDPMTGAPATSPSGGSDVQPGSSSQPQSSIPSIQPIQPAMINAISGGKSASFLTWPALVKEAADVLSLYGVYKQNQADIHDVWGELDDYTPKEAAADGNPGEPFSLPAANFGSKAAGLLKMFNVRR